MVKKVKQQEKVEPVVHAKKEEIQEAPVVVDAVESMSIKEKKENSKKLIKAISKLNAKVKSSIDRK